MKLTSIKNRNMAEMYEKDVEIMPEDIKNSSVPYYVPFVKNLAISAVCMFAPITIFTLANLPANFLTAGCIFGCALGGVYHMLKGCVESSQIIEQEKSK